MCTGGDKTWAVGLGYFYSYGRTADTSTWVRREHLQAVQEYAVGML